MHEDKIGEDRDTHCCTNYDYEAESGNLSAKIARLSIRSNHVHAILHNELPHRIRKKNDRRDWLSALFVCLLDGWLSIVTILFLGSSLL